MSSLLKTPIAKELEEIKKLVTKRVGSARRKRLREFLDGVLTIIVGIGLYDLLRAGLDLLIGLFK